MNITIEIKPEHGLHIARVGHVIGQVDIDSESTEIESIDLSMADGSEIPNSSLEFLFDSEAVYVLIQKSVSEIYSAMDLSHAIQASNALNWEDRIDDALLGGNSPYEK